MDKRDQIPENRCHPCRWMQRGVYRHLLFLLHRILLADFLMCCCEERLAWPHACFWRLWSDQASSDVWFYRQRELPFFFPYSDIIYPQLSDCSHHSFHQEQMMMSSILNKTASIMTRSAVIVIRCQTSGCTTHENETTFDASSSSLVLGLESRSTAHYGHWWWE